MHPAKRINTVGQKHSNLRIIDTFDYLDRPKTNYSLCRTTASSNSNVWKRDLNQTSTQLSSQQSSRGQITRIFTQQSNTTSNRQKESQENNGITKMVNCQKPFFLTSRSDFHKQQKSFQTERRFTANDMLKTSERPNTSDFPKYFMSKTRFRVEQTPQIAQEEKQSRFETQNSDENSMTEKNSEFLSVMKRRTVFGVKSLFNPDQFSHFERIRSQNGYILSYDPFKHDTWKYQTYDDIEQFDKKLDKSKSIEEEKGGYFLDSSGKVTNYNRSHGFKLNMKMEYQNKLKFAKKLISNSSSLKNDSLEILLKFLLVKDNLQQSLQKELKKQSEKLKEQLQSQLKDIPSKHPQQIQMGIKSAVEASIKKDELHKSQSQTTSILINHRKSLSNKIISTSYLPQQHQQKEELKQVDEIKENEAKKEADNILRLKKCENHSNKNSQQQGMEIVNIVDYNIKEINKYDKILSDFTNKIQDSPQQAQQSDQNSPKKREVINLISQKNKNGSKNLNNFKEVAGEDLNLGEGLLNFNRDSSNKQLKNQESSLQKISSKQGLQQSDPHVLKTVNLNDQVEKLPIELIVYEKEDQYIKKAIDNVLLLSNSQNYNISPKDLNSIAQVQTIIHQRHNILTDLKNIIIQSLNHIIKAKKSKQQQQLEQQQQSSTDHLIKGTKNGVHQTKSLSLLKNQIALITNSNLDLQLSKPQNNNQIFFKQYTSLESKSRFLVSSKKSRKYIRSTLSKQNPLGYKDYSQSLADTRKPKRKKCPQKSLPTSLFITTNFSNGQRKQEIVSNINKTMDQDEENAQQNEKDMKERKITYDRNQALLSEKMKQYKQLSDLTDLQKGPEFFNFEAFLSSKQTDAQLQSKNNDLEKCETEETQQNNGKTTSTPQSLQYIESDDQQLKGLTKSQCQKSNSNLHRQQIRSFSSLGEEDSIVNIQKQDASDKQKQGQSRQVSDFDSNNADSYQELSLGDSQSHIIGEEHDDTSINSNFLSAENQLKSSQNTLISALKMADIGKKDQKQQQMNKQDKSFTSENKNLSNQQDGDEQKIQEMMNQMQRLKGSGNQINNKVKVRLHSDSTQQINSVVATSSIHQLKNLNDDIKHAESEYNNMQNDAITQLFEKNHKVTSSKLPYAKQELKNNVISEQSVQDRNQKFKRRDSNLPLEDNTLYQQQEYQKFVQIKISQNSIEEVIEEDEDNNMNRLQTEGDTLNITPVENQFRKSTNQPKSKQKIEQASIQMNTTSTATKKTEESDDEVCEDGEDRNEESDDDEQNKSNGQIKSSMSQFGKVVGIKSSQVKAKSKKMANQGAKMGSRKSGSLVKELSKAFEQKTAEIKMRQASNPSNDSNLVKVAQANHLFPEIEKIITSKFQHQESDLKLGYSAAALCKLIQETSAELDDQALLKKEQGLFSRHTPYTKQVSIIGSQKNISIDASSSSNSSIQNPLMLLQQQQQQEQKQIQLIQLQQNLFTRKSSQDKSLKQIKSNNSKSFNIIQEFLNQYKLSEDMPLKQKKQILEDLLTLLEEYSDIFEDMNFNLILYRQIKAELAFIQQGENSIQQELLQRKPPLVNLLNIVEGLGLVLQSNPNIKGKLKLSDNIEVEKQPNWLGDFGKEGLEMDDDLYELIQKLIKENEDKDLEEERKKQFKIQSVNLSNATKADQGIGPQVNGSIQKGVEKLDFITEEESQKIIEEEEIPLNQRIQLEKKICKEEQMMIQRVNMFRNKLKTSVPMMNREQKSYLSCATQILSQRKIMNYEQQSLQAQKQRTIQNS